jgi:hypothetical protein
METDDRALLDDWMASWEDLIEFEVYPGDLFKRRSGEDQSSPLT